MRLEHLSVIDSTNAELLRRAAASGASAIHRLALVADHQTAGRGQRGRTWRDGGQVPGASLLLSLGWVWPGESSLDGLSLAVGLFVAEVLEARYTAAERLRLKWPNDLLCGGGKCGGVLVESASSDRGQGMAGRVRALVVGIGINLTASPPGAVEFAHPAALPPTALAAPGALDRQRRDELVACLLPTLATGLEGLADEGFAPLRARYEARMAWKGEAVRFALPTGEVRAGVLLGVTDRGALRLATADGPLTLYSGELRPVAQPIA